MPLVWAALGFALGPVWGSAWEVSWPAGALLLAATAGAFALTRTAGLHTGAVALLVAGLLAGGMRGGPELSEPDGTLTGFHGRDVEVTGRVEGLPELVGSSVRFNVSATGAGMPGRQAKVASWAMVVWTGLAIEPVPGRTFPFISHGDLGTVELVSDGTRWWAKPEFVKNP